MTLLHLVKKEILHRKLTFGLGLLSVVVAVGVLVGQLTLLSAHDMQAGLILADKQKQIEEEMKRVEDDYRKIMLKLGFNLFILPVDQRLDNFYDEGYAAKFIPEDYMDKLAASNIVTIRHLLPMVEQKIRWPEKGNRIIILIGTRGEVPFTKRDPKKPILVAVPPDSIVLGYELWNSLGLKVGDRVKMLGEDFEVSKCHPQRGTKDDITAWIDLSQAQGLLGLEGKLSGIMALQCFCHGWDHDHRAFIKKQIPGILPGAKVLFFQNKATTRAEARFRAKTLAKSSLEAEQQHRAKLRAELEAFASWLIPLVIVVSIALIALLTLRNVRARRPEIGILRALGYRSRQILYVFLAKAFFLGLVGAVLGFVIGFVVALVSGKVAMESQAAVKLLNIPLLVTVLVASPILSSFASWVPAMVAVREDPSTILREE